MKLQILITLLAIQLAALAIQMATNSVIAMAIATGLCIPTIIIKLTMRD